MIKNAKTGKFAKKSDLITDAATTYRADDLKRRLTEAESGAMYAVRRSVMSAQENMDLLVSEMWPSDRKAPSQVGRAFELLDAVLDDVYKAREAALIGMTLHDVSRKPAKKAK